MLELLSFLLFTGWSAVREAEGTRRRSSGPEVGPDGVADGDAEAAVLQAQQEFLPYTSNKIDEVRHVDPNATSSWKKMAAYTPYLTETVAMYYMLWDPDVPNVIKLQIAAALLYLVSPIDLIPDEMVPLAGWADDAAFLAGAIYNSYGYVTKEHVKQARDWLVDHGVEPTPVFALGKQFDPEPPKQQKQIEDKSSYGAYYGAYGALSRSSEEAAGFVDRMKGTGARTTGPFPLSEVDYHGGIHVKDSSVVFVSDLFPDGLERARIDARAGTPADVDVLVSGTPAYRQYAFVFIARQ